MFLVSSVSAISLTNFTISENVGNNSIYINGTVNFDELQFDSSGIRFYNFTSTTLFQNQNETWNTKLGFYGVKTLYIVYDNGTSLMRYNQMNTNVTLIPNQYVTITGQICPTGTTLADNGVTCTSGITNQGSCSSALGAFATYPALIGLIGVVFLMGMAFLFLYGYTIIKSGEPIDAAQIAVGIVVVIGIGVLIIIGIIAIETLCSVGVVA